MVEISRLPVMDRTPGLIRYPKSWSAH